MFSVIAGNAIVSFIDVTCDCCKECSGRVCFAHVRLVIGYIQADQPHFYS